ncbi:MAG: hypothetical protein HY901_32780 [Deltaproteobacteria bacterium]|nr:hypothetical protein [Deltaproteobacteria bacterium]
MVRESPLLARLMGGDQELWLFLEEMPASARAEMTQMQDASMHLLLRGVASFASLCEEERAERANTLRGVLTTAWHLMDERVRGVTSLERYAKQVAKMLVDGIGAP